jgi:hypothetical protein
MKLILGIMVVITLLLEVFDTLFGRGGLLK